MSLQAITDHEFTFDNGKSKTHYIAAGPHNGPLIIFIHGWIAVAETRKEQLLALSALGFRVVAPDTCGYGGSTVTKRALLSHLDREQAVWIGHDWGCGLVWSLASHHPEKCVAVACMTVPYRTVEFGLDRFVSMVNRDIYPIDEYPNGPWDYQAYHAEQPQRSQQVLEADPENTIKLSYRAGDPAGYGKPFAWSSQMRKNGGWFGPADSAPHVDISTTLRKNSPDIFEKLVETYRKNSTFGPNAYYLNYDVNLKYEKEKAVNGGILEFPVLFIAAKFDGVCDTAVAPKLNGPMRKACKNLTETSIDAGHWVAIEKPREVNAAIVRWLVEEVKGYWPGYWTTPFVKN
ncbi:alpha/beta-hydrolase [Tothia fuscella]|uniref:Alpha/beta-hydrolase n=1 Tax=Tothia fuscella TaxID=1048955 RepID=A0A9P4U1T9_9PEZI|nr:alpha/beta-hydrolase [Tothia fuscella]